MPPEEWAKLNDWADTRLFLNRLYPATQEINSLVFNQRLTHVMPLTPEGSPYAGPSELIQQGIFELDGTTPFLFEAEDEEETGWQDGITAGVLVGGEGPRYLADREEQGVCAVSTHRYDAYFRFEVDGITSCTYYTNDIFLNHLTDLFGEPLPPRKFEHWS